MAVASARTDKVIHQWFTAGEEKKTRKLQLMAVGKHTDWPVCPPHHSALMTTDAVEVAMQSRVNESKTEARRGDY